MRIAVCTSSNHVELQEREVPAVGPEFVLVKVLACGICGTDIASWRGEGHKKYPHTPGHEFCGTIEHLGADVPALTVGRRVVVDPNLPCRQCRFCLRGKPNLCDYLKTRPTKSNGGLAEYVAVDYRMVHSLPDVLSDALASFIEPLSCALHAANTAGVEAGQRVAVFGAGLMGCLTGVALASAGVDVVFVEPEEDRRRRIGAILNARALCPAYVDRSEGLGRIDAAIDCSGNARAVAQAMTVLPKAGRLVLAGLVATTERVALPLMQATIKELEIKGVWLNPDTFGAAIDLAVAAQDVLQRLDTEIFGLDQIQAAFDRASDRQVLKVVVLPHGDD